MPSFSLTWPQAADLAPGIRLMIALMVGLLFATAIVVGLRGQGTNSTLRSQVTSWWFLLPPVFVAWALYPVGVPALVLVISVLAAKELAGLANRQGSRGLWWSVAGLLTLQAALSLNGLSAWNVGMMLALAAITFRGWSASGGTHRESLLQALFAIQAAGLWCLVAMAPSMMPQAVAATWFLYLCVVTALNDIGQFLIGTRFGRHKLAARISPNKTWQGVGGGLVFSALFSMILGHALGLASPLWLFGMGIVLSIAGLLGDLMFSAGKRWLGIKDYSRLIPGHGGILDRVDSLVVTAPVMLISLRLS